MSATTSDEQRLLRGKVIRVPEGDSPGLIHTSSGQVTYHVEGVWRSPVPPVLNQRVEIRIDNAGSVASIEVVDGKKRAGEAAQRLGERARQAFAKTKVWLSGPGRALLNRAIAATGDFLRRQRAKGNLPKLAGAAVALLIVVFAMTGLRGCSDDAGSHDPHAPFEGKPVSRAAQLAGAWLRVDKGPLLGIEFLGDGNALPQTRNGDSSPHQYTLLEGGRVSLTAPNGRNMVYSARIGGGVLELTWGGGFSEGATQRFRRLPQGQTLAEGYRADMVQIAENRQKRVDELVKLLASDALALVTKDGRASAPIIALKVDDVDPQVRWQAERGWQGEAVIDEQPTRDFDGVTWIGAFLFRLTVQPVDDESDQLRVQIQFFRAQEPAELAGVTGMAELVTEGRVGSSVASGRVQMQKTGAFTSEPFELRIDPARHRAAHVHLEKQREAVKARHAQVTEALGGRAVLTGQKTHMNGNREPESIEITLRRDDKSGFYAIAGSVGRLPNVNGTAGADLWVGRPALQVGLGNGEQWVLNLEPDGTSFEGSWRPHARASLLEHGKITLQVTQRTSIDDVRKAREAAHAFLTGDLLKHTRFTGFATGKVGPESARWPLSLELVVAADGSVSGSAVVPAYGAGSEVTGKLQDDMLHLNAFDLTRKQLFERQSKQKFTLAVDETRVKPPVVVGALQTSWGTSEVELRPIDEATAAGQHQRLLDALAGARFSANSQIRKGEQTWFRFQVDKATGTVSGNVTGVPYHQQAYLESATLSGEVVNVPGGAALRIRSLVPRQRFAEERRDWWFYPDFSGDTPRLEGWAPYAAGNLIHISLARAP